MILLCLAQTIAVPVDDEVALRLKVLKRQAGEKRQDRRLAAYEELLEFGDPGSQIIVAAASRHLGRQLQDFEKSLKRSGAIGKHSKMLRDELDRRRGAALAVIFDRAIYPDEDHGSVGQPRVDEMVNLVREIWDNPAVHLFDVEEEVTDMFNALDDSLQWIQIAGGKTPEGMDSVDDLFVRANACFDVESWAPKSTVEWNRSTREYNRTGLFSLDDQERIVLELNNDYRWMLGRRVMEADERLIRAARDHSEEMEELGYFSHSSPRPENSSPGKRARKRGYPGGGAENIAGSGSGRGAFNAWYNSSGHHRNMLGRHAQIGIGRGGEHPGRLFTQNFGSASSVRGRTVTDPELLYIGRIRELDSEDATQQYELARWCSAVGMGEKARTHAERACELDPKHRKARELLEKIVAEGEAGHRPLFPAN